jgi:hypothetical protein
VLRASDSFGNSIENGNLWGGVGARDSLEEDMRLCTCMTSNLYGNKYRSPGVSIPSSLILDI